MQNLIRVMLVDDSVEIINAFKLYFCERSYLDYRFELVGYCRFGLPFLEMVASHKPDIAIVDVGLPDIHGIELAKQIQALPDSPQILLFSCWAKYLDYEQMVQAGFGGYMVKTSIYHLSEALVNIYEGKPWLDPEVLRAMFRRSQEAEQAKSMIEQPQIAPPSELDRIRMGLTPAEIAVFDLFLKGLKPKQMALALAIQVSTVKSHLTHIRQKIGFLTLDDLRDFLADKK